MERRRDHVRPPRHDPRLAVAAGAQAGRQAVGAASTTSSMSRRRLIMLGGVAGAVATFLPRPAAAVLKLDVTQGNVQPVPIAIPDFVAVGLPDPAGGRNVSQIIASNLRRSGLFAPIDQAAHIEKIVAIDTLPRFGDWRQINAQALVTGRITQSEGRLKAEFRLWDVFAGQQLRGEQYNTTADNWRRIAHIISDAIYERITGDKGYFDTRIVFVDESGPKERRIKRLALMDQDGANVRYLTRGDDLVLTPRFSSSADTITYMSYREGDPKVYLMNIETGVVATRRLYRVHQADREQVRDRHHAGGRLRRADSNRGVPQ